MNRRRWVVDGQVLQTGARHRGMGLYALELLSALDQSGQSRIEVLLSSAFDDSEARESLAIRVPGARVDTLDLRADTPGDAGALLHNRRVLDDYLSATSEAGSAELEPEVSFLLLSPMQGTTRPALPSATTCTRWALVFDLIPLLFPDTYLRVPELRQEYEARVAELLRADGFLTISRTVSNDLASYLGIASERIVTIEGAPIPASGTAEKLGGIREPFILMPTGNDRRKNNRRGVLAFARFNAAKAVPYQLVVTSNFEPDEVHALQSIAPDVHFTGSITGAQLADLYRRADAVLFPPTYEGLGLPVLEALQARTPIACSDIPVFREISTEAMHFFDPESVPEMARALERAVADGPPGSNLTQAIGARYSWGEVARRLLDGTLNSPAYRAPRPEITVVGPDPATDDRAGRVLSNSHAALARRARVHWVLESSASTRGRLDYLPAALAATTLQAGAVIGEDRPLLYVLDGTAACARSLVLALGRPGTVLLLDTDLTEAWEAAHAAGLISPSRADLETRLGQLEVPGAAHSAALLAVSTRILTVSEGDRRRLLAVADRMERTVEVEVVALPEPRLPFPELLPAKTRPFVELPPRSTPGFNAEFVAEQQLTRSAAAILSDADPIQALRALARGAIPVVASGRDLGIPAEFVQASPAPGGDLPAARRLAGEIAADTSRREAQAASGLEYVARYHSPDDFAAAVIAQLVQ
ncbi:Glycosyl transferases group 1 [Frankineae bacterium MT45]|nr:Glycosyl transferases group 1 [Frankineae bacterium MT45]